MERRDERACLRIDQLEGLFERGEDAIPVPQNPYYHQRISWYGKTDTA